MCVLGSSRHGGLGQTWELDCLGLNLSSTISSWAILGKSIFLSALVFPFIK